MSEKQFPSPAASLGQVGSPDDFKVGVALAGTIPDGPLGASLVELSNKLTALDKVVDSLETRLSFLLKPVVPSAPVPAQVAQPVPPSSNSKLTDHINIKAKQTHAIERKLGTILNRLEV